MSFCGAIWRINWGDAPTWLAAVFAGLAALGAFVLLRIESKRDRAADRLQRQRDEEALKWQASLCAAWPGTKSDKTSSPRTWVFQAFGAFVANGSPVPVYDVRLDFFYMSRGTADGFPVEPMWTKWIDVLPPGQIFEKAPDELTGNDLGIEPIVVAMAFRDSTNRWWRRSGTGTLDKGKPQFPPLPPGAAEWIQEQQTGCAEPEEPSEPSAG